MLHEDPNNPVMRDRKWRVLSPSNIFVLINVSAYFSHTFATVLLVPEDTDCTSALTYTEQYCLPTSEEWDCLRQRALAQDEEKCRIHRNLSATLFTAHCAHAEICVFSVTKDVFTCDDRWIDKNTDRCVRGSGDNFTCTIKGATFEKPCHRSLVHCPGGEHLGGCSDLPTLATTLDDLKICYKEYAEILGNDTVWLFVDQALYNGTAGGYGDVTILKDDRKSCVTSSPPSRFRWEWLVAIPVLIVSVVCIVIYLRKKWRSLTHVGDPTEHSEDPIAREMRKAFAVGDSIEMDLSQTTSEIVEPFGSLIITARLPEPASNHAEQEAPVEERPIMNGTADRGAEETSHASERELLNFIANSPCISPQAVALGLEGTDIDTLGPLTPGVGDDGYEIDLSRRTSGFAVKSPLMSCSSAGSGFDASRPGGIGAIVPSSARNVYTNDAMDTQGVFNVPPSSSSTGVYQNTGKPAAVHDYANEAAKSVLEEASDGVASGYFNKSTDSISDCTELSVQALSVQHVPLAFIDSDCEGSENVTDKDSVLMVGLSSLKEEAHKGVVGQEAVHLHNPTYVYFRPNEAESHGGMTSCNQ